MQSILLKDHIPRTPINKVAALVIADGIHFEPYIKPHSHFCTDVMPDTLPVPYNITNMIGQKSGRVKIIGYMGSVGESQKNKYHKWLVRCVCGNYEIREGRRWRRSRRLKRQDEGCLICRKINYITSNKKGPN